jgi:hypothetical protein
MTEDKPPVGVGVAGNAENTVVEVEDAVVEVEDGNERTPVGAGLMDIGMVWCVVEPLRCP